jgi:hypothetical protein
LRSGENLPTFKKVRRPAAVRESDQRCPASINRHPTSAEFAVSPQKSLLKQVTALQVAAPDLRNNAATLP